MLQYVQKLEQCAQIPNFWDKYFFGRSRCYRLSNLWSMIDHNHWSQRSISVKLDTLWITHKCTCFRLALHVILSYNIITNIIIPSRQFSQLWQLAFNMFNVLTCPNFSLIFCGALHNAGSHDIPIGDTAWLMTHYCTVDSLNF